MFARAMNTAFKAAPKAAAFSQRRAASGTAEEVKASAEIWFRIAWAATFGAVIPFFSFVMYKELTHEHEHHVMLPYMRIRRKDFPWGPCDLFDFECKKGLVHH